MATHADIGVSQPAASTITMKVATVTLTRNSTAQHQELLTIADAETTNALARVSTGVPSTHAGLVTRSLVYQSSAADNAASVYQSTFTDLNCRINAPSTANSSNYLPVRITDGSSYITPGAEYTDASTASSLAGPALLFNNSSNNTMRMVGSAQPLPVHLRTSSGAEVVGSTAQPAGNVVGLPVRPVFPTLNSTTILVTSTHSTAVYELLSSVAAVAHKVFAYFVGSTHTNPSTLVFMSSAAAGEPWHVNFGSGSSGITGANLAVTPPAWLFRAVTANALNCRIEGGSSVTSTVVARISLSWFDEA